MKEILKSVWCLSAILGILSCHNSPPLEDRLEQLAQAFHDLDCRQATLEAETSSSWDDVVAQLDARLPESMPAAEKNNMLMVRNAGLIRMFESYHELPDSVQALGRLRPISRHCPAAGLRLSSQPCANSSKASLSSC